MARCRRRADGQAERPQSQIRDCCGWQVARSAAVALSKRNRPLLGILAALAYAKRDLKFVISVGSFGWKAPSHSIAGFVNLLYLYVLTADVWISAYDRYYDTRYVLHGCHVQQLPLLRDTTFRISPLSNIYTHSKGEASFMIRLYHLLPSM